MPRPSFGGQLQISPGPEMPRCLAALLVERARKLSFYKRLGHSKIIQTVGLFAKLFWKGEVTPLSQGFWKKRKESQ